MGSVVLFICHSSCVLYSAVSVVKNGHVVLSVFRMMLFVCGHAYISCRYDLIFVFLIFLSVYVAVVEMSCAYLVSYTGACSVRMSDVHTLKRVVDNTPPCGTPLLNLRSDSVLFLTDA